MSPTAAVLLILALDAALLAGLAWFMSRAKLLSPTNPPTNGGCDPVSGWARCRGRGAPGGVNQPSRLGRHPGSV